MGAHALREVQDYAGLMLVELRKVIPAFLQRLDRPERGGVWSQYLRETREATAALARRALDAIPPEPRPEVTLTDWGPDGAGRGGGGGVLAADVGRRENRRHKPGRAFERTVYRFDVLGDYGAFRDLQRHRLLTLEWQPLSPRHRHVTPEGIEGAGG